MAGRSPILEQGAFGARSRPIHWAQEMFDQAGMVREFVKWDYELRDPAQASAVVARALEVDETRGFMKAVVDTGSGQILGAAVLGIEGGEIMAMLQLAMMGRLPFPVLREGIFAHPTLAESLNNLFTHFEG